MIGSLRSASGIRRAASLLLIVLALGLVGAGCGSSSSSSASGGSGAAPSSQAAGGSGSGGTKTTHFAKTKFVLHMGLAFGAFHHWIYKPVKAGDLRHPLSHKVALIKAGLAAAFVYHELKLALGDAQSSPTLSKLVAPITALQNRIHGLGPGLRSGSANSAEVDQANSSIGSIKSDSASAGQPINEQVPSSLASGG